MHGQNWMMTEWALGHLYHLDTGMNTRKKQQDRGEAMTWQIEEKRSEDGGLLLRSGPRPLTPVFNFDLKYSNIMYFNY